MGREMSADEGRAFYDPVDTLADVERVWPTIAARRPRLIKLILINSNHRERDRAEPRLFGNLGMDPALVAPIVERAHAAGIRVAVHTDSAHDFDVAVRAGADIIAHLPGYRIAEGMRPDEYRILDETVAEAARRGTTVITTTVVAGHDIRRRPRNAAALRALQIDNLSRLRAAGVPLAIGSDHVLGSAVDELLYLDSLGVMPRAELLRRATLDTPRLIFPERQIGAFAEGAEASLVAYDADPIETLETLRQPRILVQRGSLLSLAPPPEPVSAPQSGAAPPAS
jgi:imidazolonepropionase-like amidohydrolase